MTYGKKGNACHKSLHGVMANTGFGGLYIKRGNLTIFVPKFAIKKDGTLKKNWAKRLTNPTFEDAMWINAQVAA